MTSEERLLERAVVVEREALFENLASLKEEAEALTDWQTYVRKHPLAMVGLAFGGGVLLAAMGSGGRRRHSTPAHRANDARSQERPSRERPRPSAAHEAWQTLTGALVGAAATHVGTYVNKILPDFGHQLDSQRTSVQRARGGGP